MKFRHYPLEMVSPEFDSSLMDLIIELDHLRKMQLHGSTHSVVFYQLKSLFHTLESIGSARIEGNRTTIAEYIDSKLSIEKQENQSIIEIENMTVALNFIDENVFDFNIDRAFVSELHKLVVKDLNVPPQGEGDLSPGVYRKTSISILGTEHNPPPPHLVDGYMEELYKFINENNASKYDLLKTAISHHRFVWIHPFSNGNGRTVRLLTYAMLVKLGFRLNTGNRIINPTAIFCSDRNKYYDFLTIADSGKKDDILSWVNYVLEGLKNEIEKIDRILDYNFLKDNVLFPAVKYAYEHNVITSIEYKILNRAIELKVLKAGDLNTILPNKSKPEVSRYIRNLKDKNMLIPESENSRKYVISFNNNYLLRAIIMQLDIIGFLPLKYDS